MALPYDQIGQLSAMRDMRAAQLNELQNQAALGGLRQGLGGLMGQQQAYQSLSDYAKPKPILGLDKGEKARDYLQRKVDGWLSGVEI